MAHKTEGGGRGGLLFASTTSPVPPERPPNPNVERKYNAPPKNVRVNSQNGATSDGRSPQPRWARRQMHRLERWIRKLLRRKAKHSYVGVIPESKPPDSGPEETVISKPKRSDTGSIKSAESEPYIRTFKLELIDKNNKPVMRHVQVLLDTGNPRNILSSKLVQTFNLGLEDDGGRVALKTIGNNEWHSIGKIKGRFILESNDASWVDAEFEVSKCDEHYDAVLGSKSLNKYNMVKVNENLPPAFSGFRCERAYYTKEEIEQREKDQKKRREENEALKAEALKNASVANMSTSSSSSR